MHGEVVSEGEKPTTGPSPTGDDDMESSPPQPNSDTLPQQPQPPRSTTPTPITNQPEDDPQEESQDQEQEITPVSQKRRRRRSRSRSRSRSRDFKDMSQSRPDSPDDNPIPPLPLSLLASPNPPPPFNIYQAQAQRHAQQMQGRPFFNPAQQFYHSPASPSSPSPLPSLDAIRAGLFRSNSARLAAMHKLTGGTESPEPLVYSPSPTPPQLLARSNTVSGGERMAARRLLMRTLGGRTGTATPTAPISESNEEATKEGDELTSGGEEIVLPRRRAIPPDLSTPVHRRSPLLNGANTVIDDRDEKDKDAAESPSDAESRSVGTPIFGFSQIPYGQQTYPHGLPVSHPPSEYDRQDEPRSIDEHYDYDGAEYRDGVVIERDESEDIDETINHPISITSSSASSSFHLGLPPPTPHIRRPRPSSRPSDIPSTTSSTLTISATDDAIPLYMPTAGQASPYTQDAFPVTISPFGTPIKERSTEESEEEAERVVYPEDMQARKAYLERLESESNLSWKDEEESDDRMLF